MRKTNLARPNLTGIGCVDWRVLTSIAECNGNSSSDNDIYYVDLEVIYISMYIISDLRLHIIYIYKIF